MRTQKLVLTGEINEKMLGNFIPMFKQYDSKKCNIQMFISSGGGEVDAGAGMYEIMRTSHNIITTVGVGLVGSMAVLLFEAGDIRVATEGTTFLLHDGSVTARGTLMAVKSHLEETLRNHNWYAEQIAHRCRVPLKKILDLTSKESYLTAQEALKLKLIDTIIPYREYARLRKTKE